MSNPVKDYVHACFKSGDEDARACLRDLGDETVNVLREYIHLMSLTDCKSAMDVLKDIRTSASASLLREQLATGDQQKWVLALEALRYNEPPDLFVELLEMRKTMSHDPSNAWKVELLDEMLY